jgi:hypothetical protein
MADTAAHLVDRVLPAVPMRQWVLFLPFALRYRLAYDAALTSAVLPRGDHLERGSCPPSSGPEHGRDRVSLPTDANAPALGRARAQQRDREQHQPEAEGAVDGNHRHVESGEGTLQGLHGHREARHPDRDAHPAL